MDRFFLRTSIIERGAGLSPTGVAPWADSKQRIGFIKLRLEPPVHFQSWRDVVDVFMNHEFLRVQLAIAWIIICGLIESFLAQLSDMRFADITFDKHTLRDLLHDAFPRIENYQIVNYLLLTIVVCTLLGFLLQSPDWTMRWIVLRRWLVIMGFIYIFRGICLVVTTLPSSRMNDCQPPEVALHGSTGERLAFLFNQIVGGISPCTDNIFSGHTSTMMSCVMVWRIHSRLTRPFTWFIYLLFIAAVLIILFTRFHYTVDVILAIYISYSAWYIYMNCIQEAVERAVFGFQHHSTLDLFRSQFNSFDASAIYAYLTWQPNPIPSTWLIHLISYCDGLDIRLRALGILDEHGNPRRESLQLVDVHQMTTAANINGGMESHQQPMQSLPV